MRMKVNEFQYINFGRANIADLQNILDMYTCAKEKAQGSPKALESKPSLVTNYFGVPLCTAYFGEKLVGYGTALINRAGEIEINSYVEEGLSVGDIKSKLEEESQKAFKVSFNEGPAKADTLRYAIDRLVYWINQW